MITLVFILRLKGLARPNSMNYRRVFVPDTSYFFTLTLQNRKSELLIHNICALRIAFQHTMKIMPFTIDGIVVLPDHMHMTMTLPPGDVNYSQRINFIKSTFSRQIEPTEQINSSRKTKRERGIWQRRFWEHTIRNEEDFERHLNYIHYNPVKHGHVQSPSQWAYSSIHRYIKLGILPHHWASLNMTEENFNQKFGE